MATGDLDASEAVATDGFAWCAIAAACVAAGDTERAQRCLDRAVALAGSDVAVIRNAVRIRNELGEHAQACRDLAAFAGTLLHREAASQSWSLVAASWIELGDRDAARDYLVHAERSANAVDELCIASLVTHALDAPWARTLIERAAGSAASTPELLDVFDAYRAILGEHDHRDLLVRARELVSRPSDAVQIASVYRSLDAEPDGEAMARSLEAGERVAASLDDWFTLAHGWADVAIDRQRALACFDRALRLAVTDDDRRRVAQERQRHDPVLRPPDRIARVARTPAELLPRRDGWCYRPDPARLFELLRARVGEQQLNSIAINDYGFAADNSRPVLDAIVATGTCEVPLDSNARENLELARWKRDREVDHLERAFACTLICLTGPTHGGEYESMARLVASCIALGGDAVDAMLALFAAMPDHVFLQLGIVLGAASRDPSDPRVAAAVAKLRALDGVDGVEPWPGGFVFRHSKFDVCFPDWRALARTVLDHPIPHLRDVAVLLDAAV